MPAERQAPLRDLRGAPAPQAGRFEVPGHLLQAELPAGAPGARKVGWGMIPLRVEVPLRWEDAYWHACSGTPYEPRYLVPVFGKHAVSNRWFFLAPP